MKFNFDWNYISAGAPYVTVSELGLAFNAPSISLLGNPENVLLGFDDENMVIGVKAYDGTQNVKTYTFFSRMKNGWIRIGCRDFVKYLSSKSGLKFNPAKRYIAKFDADEKILYISVMECSDKSDEEEKGGDELFE